MDLLALLLIVSAYFIGSISSAIVVCKLMGFQDPRGFGSGNPGATNVLRLAGRSAAAITLIGDIIKGFFPVLVAKLFFAHDWVLANTALAVFLGHVYPVFFQFRGGKGIATAFGAFCALSWMLGVAIFITWLLVALITRISSAAAIISALLTPIFIIVIIPSQTYWLFGCVVVMATLSLWRHRSNIKNILAGQEKKIGG